MSNEKIKYFASRRRASHAFRISGRIPRNAVRHPLVHTVGVAGPLNQQNIAKNENHLFLNYKKYHEKHALLKQKAYLFDMLECY